MLFALGLLLVAPSHVRRIKAPVGSLGQVLPLYRSRTHVQASSDGKQNGRWRQAGVLMSVHLEASTDQAATGGGDVSHAPNAAAQPGVLEETLAKSIV